MQINFRKDFIIKPYIEERVITIAQCFVTQKMTVRELGKKFKISKSTVHKDLKERLQEIDQELFLEAQIVLKEHLDTRHLRGGEATKERFMLLKRKIVSGKPKEKNN